MQFNDPTRDWATDMDERVHTLAFSVDVPHLTDRMSATTGYDVVGSRARYMYLLEADTTLAPVPQLPPVRNVVHAATVDVRRTFTRQLALGVSYRTEPVCASKGRHSATTGKPRRFRIGDNRIDILPESRAAVAGTGYARRPSRPPSRHPDAVREGPTLR